MTKEEALISQFKKAVQRLEEVLNNEKTTIVRDSAIKRFEMAFDLSWKCLKEYLSEEKGLICQSPKDCFRMAYRAGLIHHDKGWIKMTNDRNLSVHTYEEALADEIYETLPETLDLFKELLKTIAR